MKQPVTGTRAPLRNNDLINNIPFGDAYYYTILNQFCILWNIPKYVLNFITVFMACRAVDYYQVVQLVYITVCNLSTALSYLAFHTSYKIF